MHMIIFQKMKFSALTLVVAIFTLVACQKDLSGDLPVDAGPLPDLVSKIPASVSGFVTDENNAVVSGATVQFGTSTTTTDRYGYFSFRNVQAVKNAAVVTVIKSGYFKGIKTYIAEANTSAFFRIKLIPKNTAGSFTASTGGTVSLPNGTQVQFPANAIVNAATNVAYTGTVNVSAQWINPTATDLSQIMPGDLRGLDEAGYLKILTTYGMMAVELTGTSGEMLQIATGSKATLTFPLPAVLNASAPTNIPLWYFDETLGLWKQEGSAVKTGNSYVGEVSHFSYWNCDVPNNYVQFNCTVLDTAGNPVQHAFVKVSVVGSPYRSGFGYTDSAGYTGGAVPNNAQLLLEVYPDFNCGTPAYSQNFSTTNVNVSLGNIVVNTTSYAANVTGTVTDCSNNPVTNGFVIVNVNQRYYRYAISNNGTFDFSMLMCSNASNATIIAEDLAGGQQSNPLSYTINTGNNAVPNLQACGTSISQFINYSINGTSYSLTAPADSFIVFSNPQVTPTRIEINGNMFNTAPGGSRYVAFDITDAGIAVGSTQSLINFYTTDIMDSTIITSPINVNITEYGSVGQFIAGNFTGILNGSGPPPSATYNITCNFRVRRR